MNAQGNPDGSPAHTPSLRYLKNSGFRMYDFRKSSHTISEPIKGGFIMNNNSQNNQSNRSNQNSRTNQSNQNSRSNQSNQNSQSR